MNKIKDKKEVSSYFLQKTSPKGFSASKCDVGNCDELAKLGKASQNFVSPLKNGVAECVASDVNDFNSHP